MLCFPLQLLSRMVSVSQSHCPIPTRMSLISLPTSPGWTKMASTILLSHATSTFLNVCLCLSLLCVPNMRSSLSLSSLFPSPLPPSYPSMLLFLIPSLPLSLLTNLLSHYCFHNLLLFAQTVAPAGQWVPHLHSVTGLGS